MDGLIAIVAAILWLAAAYPKEVDCLAAVIHHEARGEDLKGQLLVAEVVLNRVKHEGFPDTICKVTAQPGQFVDTRVPRNEEAYAVAYLVLQAELVVPSTGALYFYSGSKPNYLKNKEFILKHGGHYFYR